MTEKNLKKSRIELAYELYGKQRDFTEKEREIYKKVTDEDSVPLGINIFDLMEEYKKNNS